MEFLIKWKKNKIEKIESKKREFIETNYLGYSLKYYEYYEKKTYLIFNEIDALTFCSENNLKIKNFYSYFEEKNKDKQIVYNLEFINKNIIHKIKFYLKYDSNKNKISYHFDIYENSDVNFRVIDYFKHNYYNYLNEKKFSYKKIIKLLEKEEIIYLKLYLFIRKTLNELIVFFENDNSIKLKIIFNTKEKRYTDNLSKFFLADINENH